MYAQRNSHCEQLSLHIPLCLQPDKFADHMGACMRSKTSLVAGAGWSGSSMACRRERPAAAHLVHGLLALHHAGERIGEPVLELRVAGKDLRAQT
jgi:hypothetical protein